MRKTIITCDVYREEQGSNSDLFAFEFDNSGNDRFRFGRPDQVERHICRDCVVGLVRLHERAALERRPQ